MDTPAPSDEGFCIASGLSHPCEVSASVRGVDDELKASLRLHRVYIFCWLVCLICCIDLLVYRGVYEDRNKSKTE